MARRPTPGCLTLPNVPIAALALMLSLVAPTPSSALIPGHPRPLAPNASEAKTRNGGLSTRAATRYQLLEPASVELHCGICAQRYEVAAGFSIYANANPLKYTDPMGLAGQDPDAVATYREFMQQQREARALFNGPDYSDLEGAQPGIPVPGRFKSTPKPVLNEYLAATPEQIEQKQWRMAWEQSLEKPASSDGNIVGFEDAEARQSRMVRRDVEHGLQATLLLGKGAARLSLEGAKFEATGIVLGKVLGVAGEGLARDLSGIDEAGNVSRSFKLPIVDQPVCFLAGTLVTTAAGEKSIEEIQPGDQVLSYNEETGETGYRAVSKQMPSHTETVCDVSWETASPDGGEVQTVRTTPTHPFFVEGTGWISASALSASDELLTDRGEGAVVQSVTCQSDSEPTYNFEVEGWHTYFVGENPRASAVLVHNTCPPGMEQEIRAYRGLDVERMDPRLRADPRLVVDMPYIGKGNPEEIANVEGWARSRKVYWDEIRRRAPQAFSSSNTFRMDVLGRAPRNDPTFRTFFTQYDQPELFGEVLEHHHIGRGGQAVGLPQSLHAQFDAYEDALGLRNFEADVAGRLQTFVDAPVRPPPPGRAHMDFP